MPDISGLAEAMTPATAKRQSAQAFAANNAGAWQKEIEEERERLDHLVETGASGDEIMEQSRKIDKLIEKYYEEFPGEKMG